MDHHLPPGPPLLRLAATWGIRWASHPTKRPMPCEASGGMRMSPLRRPSNLAGLVEVGASKIAIGVSGIFRNLQGHRSPLW